MNGVVVACIILTSLGALAALRWGHLLVVPPWVFDVEGAAPAALERLKRFLWHLDVLLLAAIGTGLLVVGPGGRLVMRLLAVTAGDTAQGKVTEADEIVGRITVGGTIGFVVFVGLFGGLVLALIWGGLRKWLPRGRLGALAAGGLFAVAFATRLEPLRPDNEDFGIVGPGWLSVLSFLLLGALSVLTLAAVAGRVSSSLPVLAWRPAPLLAHLPLVLLVPMAGAGGLIVVGGIVGILLLGQPWFERSWQRPRLLLVGRGLLVAATLALLPSFVADLLAIV